MPDNSFRMVCRNCGSEDVICDAYAVWDFSNQVWVIDSTFDKGAYCNACDGETRIVEKEDTGN